MKINYRAFPHPVLSHFSDDFVGCAFQCTVNIESSTSYYRLSVANQLSDDTIATLIADQKASYALHVECRPTRYRTIHRSRESEFALDIDASQVDGEVEICCLIVADNEIESYKSRNFHPDFNGYQFTIQKGDILAVANDRRFFADKSLDSLKKIPSIFSVVANNSPTAEPLSFEPLGNKIVVYLREDLYNQYRTLRQNQSLHTTLAQMVIVPVLVDLVTELQNSDDNLESEYGSTHWYRAIQKRASEIGLEFGTAKFSAEPALTFAMKLIEEPLGKALDTLMIYEG